MTFTVDRYPPAVRELLADYRELALDAGSPNSAARKKLAALTPELVVGHEPVDRSMAECCRAALWLFHDFLAESHEVSQEVHSTTGTYWHAIMHRREGDYSNARYWLDRVARHETFPTLHAAARSEFGRRPAAANDPTRPFAPLEIVELLNLPVWDPHRFVDLCRSACSGRNDLAPACRALQLLEWRILFDFCFTAAGGRR